MGHIGAFEKIRYYRNTTIESAGIKAMLTKENVTGIDFHATGIDRIYKSVKVE